jgi:hypothetical protein
MDPFRWKREHQLACIVICLIEATLWLPFTWIQYLFYYLCHSSVSGEWANCSRVFLMWLPNTTLYWPSDSGDTPLNFAYSSCGVLARDEAG